MKAIRIIAIVLVLFATACGSAGEEGAQIESADAEPSTSADDAGPDGAGDDAGGGSDALHGTADHDADHDEAVDHDEEDGSGHGDSETDDATTSSEPTMGDTDAVGNALLARVSDATVEASTARFEGRLAVAAAPGSELAEGFELTLSGAYDLAADASEITIDLSGLAALVAAETSPGEADMFASMFAEPVRFRAIGGTAWVRLGLLGSMFGATLDDGSTAWIEAELDEASSMTGQFGVETPESPTDLLQILADLDATVTEVGREQVRGVETTHYRIVIDLEAAARQLPAEDRAELEAELPGGIAGELPVDVWMDDDDLLRRLVIELDDFDAMGIDTDSNDVASVLIEFEIFDVGEAISVEPPPADQVITIEELGFNLGGDL